MKVPRYFILQMVEARGPFNSIRQQHFRDEVLPPTVNLNALDLVGANVWAGGDSGSTWAAQTSNTTYPVQGIWMVSETIGWAVCSNTASNTGAILKTTTGGN